MPIEAIRDHRLINIIRNAARVDLFGDSRTLIGRLIHGVARLIDGWIGIILGEGDPNDIRLDGDKGIGLTRTPVSTEKGQRRGARERVQRVIASGKYALRVEYGALATRVIFEGQARDSASNTSRATISIARAPNHRRRQENVARPRRAARSSCARAPSTRLSCLCCPAWAQPRSCAPTTSNRSLSSKASAQNLQDRYEISAIHRTTKPWSCLAGVEFSTDDPMFAEWRLGRGMYRSNGAAVAFVGRSLSAREAPDLFADGVADALRRLFPRLFERHPREPQRPQLRAA